MRALHLASSFLAIAIASSALTWLAGLGGGLPGLVAFIYALIAMAYVACWMIDGPIQQYLGLDEEAYSGAIVGAALATLIGGLARPCLTLLT